MKQKAIVFDIDGVLLDTHFILDEIVKLGLKGEDMWEYFYDNCNSDKVKAIKGAQDFVHSFKEDIPIILCTVRSAKFWAKTYHKLEDLGIKAYDCYFRPKDDLRKAVEVKRDLLKEIQEEYEIVAFIDDNEDNCEMAKELGILSLRRV